MVTKITYRNLNAKSKGYFHKILLKIKGFQHSKRDFTVTKEITTNALLFFVNQYCDHLS